MSFVSRLIDPNPPLTAAQVQAAAAAALIARPAVASVQRGVIDISGFSGYVPSQDEGTVTITAVVLAKSVLRVLSIKGGRKIISASLMNGVPRAKWGDYYDGVVVKLSSATEISWERSEATGSFSQNGINYRAAPGFVVSYEVVEYS